MRLDDSLLELVRAGSPTGSGKSTTLAAMVDHINRTRAGHILTIEDPVEFVHQPRRCLVTHKEVGDHVPSFLEAIRSAGRENADVILVGELRGAETMKAALQLASFGILIYATVHTNSAAATIDRFVNAFPAQGARQGSLRQAAGDRPRPRPRGGADDMTITRRRSRAEPIDEDPALPRTNLIVELPQKIEPDQTVDIPAVG